MRKLLVFVLVAAIVFMAGSLAAQSVIRINQLGYTPEGIKAAVYGSKQADAVTQWQLVNAETRQIVDSGLCSRDFGDYAPFTQTRRIVFSNFNKPGNYYLLAGDARSPVFRIAKNVYAGTADFALRYMRQQRCGFNPFLKDSCHTADGYSLYGEKAGIPDSTYFNGVGGWHDASDYLQYVTTTANATYQMMMAYREFPKVFSDRHLANGLEGRNNVADIVDEANWGLEWLVKMNPSANVMFGQLADDRDHISMRRPAMDSQYGRGYQRPMYYVTGEPQQRGKFLNSTTGTSSIAGKFASAFAMASLFAKSNSSLYAQKAREALAFALKKPGYTQTASVSAPYIYGEENWVDDMQLAYATLGEALHPGKPGEANSFFLEALKYAEQEPVTPWMIHDTASHYQYYPFVNAGHYRLLRNLQKGSEEHKQVLGYYKQGIEIVYERARQNAFLRGVPFIWCSNNLTVGMAQQLIWYRQQSGQCHYKEFEQANIDWLFGLNPWGTSMVYGLPAHGDTPVDPHSWFTHSGKIPIDGGLIDGPVYTAIFKSLIGITLYNEDAYAPFQSDLAVYHDDYGDYSTNEPTMDGTASLIYLLAAIEDETRGESIMESGAVIRGDTNKKKLSLIFSAHEFADGHSYISNLLKTENIPGAFFFTGDFYRNPGFGDMIGRLKADGHYLGPHSDKHLLYADWNKRDSTLVTKSQFMTDLRRNQQAMRSHGIEHAGEKWFLPPYEWYNDSIAAWSAEAGVQLINFTPGTIVTADYTFPGMSNYRNSGEILNNILTVEKRQPDGLNGYIMLVHFGADPRRTDKFYRMLPTLVTELKRRGYQFVGLNELL